MNKEIQQFIIDTKAMCAKMKLMDTDSKIEAINAIKPSSSIMKSLSYCSHWFETELSML